MPLLLLPVVVIVLDVSVLEDAPFRSMPLLVLPMVLIVLEVSVLNLLEESAAIMPIPSAFEAPEVLMILLVTMLLLE